MTLALVGRTPALSCAGFTLLCILLCVCSSVTSSESPVSDGANDCLSFVENEGARNFLRSRAMQPDDVFACEAVEHLGLGGGGDFTGKQVHLVAPALLRMRELKTLDLSHMSLDSHDLQSLAPVLTTLRGLQRLSLNGNSLGPRGAEVLVNSVTSTRMEWLQLEHTALGADGLKILLHLLLRQNSTLTWLSLENCNLGAQGAAVLAGAVGAFTRLHELNIARNSIGDVGCNAILAAAPWNSMRKLWLGGNALTCAALEHFQGRSIQLLQLSDNALAPNCSATLAAALLQMPELRTLHLNGNVLLGDSGAAAVAAVFDSLRSLSHVAMVGWHLSQHTREAVSGAHQLPPFQTESGVVLLALLTCLLFVFVWHLV